MQTSTVTSDRLSSERRFYTGISIAILLSVFVGFAKSFFLRPLFPEHVSPTEPVIYVHGALFTLWIVLFVAQVALIKQKKVETHRMTGYFGVVLAVGMFVLGILGALTAANRSGGFVGIPVPALSFLAIPMFDMILFPAFVVMAVLKRDSPQDHKRWMLLATLNLIPAAIGRWPGVSALGPIGAFGITDLFVVALAVWDFRSRGRLHPVTLWGGILMIISQPLRIAVSGTAAWLSFAEWATGLVK